MKFKNIRLLALGTLAFAGVSCQPDIIVEEAIHVTSVSLSTSTARLYVGETLQLNADVLPENAKEKGVDWTSNNTTSATVDENGLVTALSPGNATITVTSRDGGLSARCRFTVEMPIDPVTHVTGIILDKSSASLNPGETFTLTATLEPADADDQIITWKSSAPAVATVAEGTVTAVAPVRPSSPPPPMKAASRRNAPSRSRSRGTRVRAGKTPVPTFPAIPHTTPFPRSRISPASTSHGPGSRTRIGTAPSPMSTEPFPSRTRSRCIPRSRNCPT